MKNKYQRMSKEEKKDLKEKYLNTKEGKSKINRLNRLFIIGIIGIRFSIILIVSAVLNKQSILDYICGGILFVFSIVYLIGSINIKQKELNKFALKQK